MAKFTETFEPAITTVQNFLDQVAAGIEVADYAEYRAVMHDSGLCEALGALIVAQPNTRGVDLNAQTGRGHLSRQSLDVWSQIGEGMVTIRTRKREGAGARVRHNLYLYSGLPGNFGDIASVSGNDQTLSAESWNGYHHRPSPAYKLNKVIEYGSVAVEQFVSLVV